MKNRNSIEICVDILHYCNGNELSISELMNKARLNHSQARNFLNFLISRQYIEQKEGYKTTEIGLEYLEAMKPVAFTARANTVVEA